MPKQKPPLIMRLPRGLREQPAWVFIGVLLTFSGLTYALGLAESAIVKAIGECGLRVWGVALMLSGVLLVTAVVKARPSLEKLALRTMTCTLMVYAGYLLLVAPFERVIMSVVLVIILCGLAEFRVMHLRALIVRAGTLTQQLGAGDE